MRNRIKLLLVAFAEGAFGLGFELCAHRILAPSYGLALSVWSSVLAISFLGLSIGYFLGSAIYRRYRSSEPIGWLMLGSVLVLLMILIFSEYIGGQIADPNDVTFILSALLILALPLALAAATISICIGLYTDLGNSAQKASGTIFFVSTLGGIFSVIISGFWLIPAYGISFSLLITGAFWVVATFSFLKNRWLGFGALIMLAIAGVIRVKNAEIGSTTVVVKEYSEGLMGQLLVTDMHYNQRDTVRMLFLNRMGQTCEYLPGPRSCWDYVEVITKYSEQYNAPRVLLVGLGGGSMANSLASMPGGELTAIELDHRISDAAKKYFDLSASVRIINDDARHFLRKDSAKYELVILDIFQGDVPPAHVLSLEGFSSIKDRLVADGSLLINYNGFLEGREGTAARAVIRTLEVAGFEVNVVKAGGNEATGNSVFIASANELAKEKISNTGMKTIDADEMPLIETAEILKDNRPILEVLNRPAAEAWRKSYYQDFTLPLRDHGIPLFR